MNDSTAADALIERDCLPDTTSVGARQLGRRRRPTLAAS
jgi:hypothetical protein